MKENFFLKIRRRVKQTFESLYWYRWRKGHEFTLPSCWNGSSDILNCMLSKLEHIMYAQRKYSNEMDYWFSLSNPKDEDLNRYLSILLNNLEYDRPIFLGNKKCDKTISERGYLTYSFVRIDKNSFVIIETSYKHRDASTVKKDNKLYEIDSFEPLTFKECEYFYENDRCIFSTFEFDELTTEKVNKITGLKLKDFKKTLLESVHTLEIYPKDLLTLTDDDKKLLRGRKVSYCRMNKFRHLLKKYINLTNENICDKKILKEKNKLAIEVFSYLDKYGDTWWF